MIEFAIITALILLNAIFVAAEFAIVGAPRAAVEARAAQGDRMAKQVQRVLRDTQLQDRYIATAQLGITLASLGLGMYGEHVLADAIYSALGRTGAPAWLVSHGVAKDGEILRPLDLPHGVIVDAIWLGERHDMRDVEGWPRKCWGRRWPRT